MPPKLDQINIVVRDMDAMSDFYRQLGLQIETPPPEWAPHHRSSRHPDEVDFAYRRSTSRSRKARPARRNSVCSMPS